MEALLHLLINRPRITTAIIHFDSKYAHNMVTGKWKPRRNLALIVLAKQLLKLDTYHYLSLIHI